MTAVAAATDEAREILISARGAGRSALLEHEVYALLELAGFRTPRRAFWEGAPGERVPDDVAELLAAGGGRALLKIVSPDLLHKAEVGGIAAVEGGIAAARQVARSVWDETARRAPQARRLGILVVERLAPRAGLAAESLVSVKHDPAFGPAVVFGLGGGMTEWLGALSSGQSVAVLQPGLVRRGLQAAVDRLPAFQLLFRPSRLGERPPLVLDDVAESLEALARLAVAFGPERPDGDSAPTLEELEVNPVLLTTDGRWVAVDGKGRLSDRRVVRAGRPLRKIRSLLHPRSAAVFGASASAVNPGRIILRNLKASEGLTYGKLRAIHPTAESIDGVPCVASIARLAEPVDLAVVAVPAEGAAAIVEDLARDAKAEAIILIPGGFAETGRRGPEEAIREALASSRLSPGEGPVLVGGNCLGVVSKHEYNTFFLPQYKLPFHDAPGDRLVAISQSGAYLVSLSSNLDGIVFPRASISFGNQMDLTVSDFLEHFETEDAVSVIACYVEGFQPLDGERFVRSARRLRERGKRVLVYKAGRTQLGAEAARTHTASLAGDYAVAAGLLEQAGVVVAQTLDMLEDYAKVFTLLFDRIPAGRRLGVLSNAGFECGAVLDRLYRLVPAALSASTREALRACLPGIAHADNPVDTTPMATTEQFVAAAEALLGDPGVDALLVSPIPVAPSLDDLPPDLSGAHAENIFAPRSLPQELLRLFAATRKPVAVSVDSGRLYDAFVQVLQRGGIPVYRKVDRASRALSALCTA